MTDRELLEAAATAAGIVLHVWGAKGHENFADMTDGGNHKLWNPLTDDGDALRLAVKLSLDLCVSPNTALCAWSEVTHDWMEEPPGGDPCAAMRRAIVRAAAGDVR